MDKIVGPVEGYHIALRAEPEGDDWTGYARIFKCRPRHYEDVDCVLMLVSDKQGLRSAEEAWAHAEALARDRLPGLEKLA